MRIVFMGTPDFAVPSLQALLSHHQVVGVVTQPDRPAGRGQALRVSPVKAEAEEHGVLVLQPAKVSEASFIEWLEEVNPDGIVVVAFGQKIPQTILDLPRFGCINVHGSLLPRYRGASPIHWAIIDGNEVTGVTTMLMDAGWDTGDILLQADIPIDREDTAGTLHDKLAVLGADTLVKTLAGLESGDLQPRAQDSDQANYVRMLKKEDAVLDWNQRPNRVVDFIRGMQPWPTAYTFYQGRMLKLWKARAASWEVEPGTEAGTILGFDDEAVYIAVSDGVVAIMEVQPENSKRISGRDFVNGYRVEVGSRLGEEVK